MNRFQLFLMILLCLSVYKHSTAQEKSKEQVKRKISFGIHGGITQALPPNYKTMIEVPSTPVIKSYFPSVTTMNAECKLKYKVDCMFGISFQTKFPNGFEFRTELNYERLKKNYWNPSGTYYLVGWNVPTKFNYTTTYEHISLPVLYKATHGYYFGKTEIYVPIGIFATYLFRSYSQGEADAQQVSFRKKEDVLTGGLVGDIVFTRKLDTNMRLTVQLRDYITLFNNTKGFYIDNTCRIMIGVSYNLK